MSTLFETDKPLWVDPPSGWMYGFPAIWDPSKETLEELLDRHKYPQKWRGLGVRMWEVTEDNDGELVICESQ